LREPLERLQSQILYDWSLARIEFESDQLENQVIEFLDSSRGYRISNLYTWTFGGFDCLEEDIEEAREQATICLEKFAIVGTQSRMEELEMRINQLTGLQINVGTTNVTKAKREEDEASFHELKNLLQKDSIKDRMAHMTSGDQRIYDKFCNS
jgi:hypothetical protein